MNYSKEIPGILPLQVKVTPPPVYRTEVDLSLGALNNSFIARSSQRRNPGRSDNGFRIIAGNDRRRG